MHTNLTLEERERFAYIEGRTGEAALLAKAADDEGQRDEEFRELEEHANEQDDKVVKLEGELEDLKDKVAELEEQIHNASVDLL
jgi:phage shock protein A